MLPIKKVVGGHRIRKEDEDELSFDFKIDGDKIEDLVEDFEEFSDKYLSKTKKERVKLMKKLTEAFRNTAAKIILNFGKIIPPVVHSWSEVMRHVQVNPECDQKNAVKCLDPMVGYETLYFNPHCLAKYNCKFEIEDLDPKMIRTKMDNITRNYENVNRFFNKVNVENMKRVKPAFDAYLEKASELHQEFGELLKEHGAKILGCEETCIEDCLDTDFISFWEIPMCVKNCHCKEGLISIERGGEELYGTSSYDSLFGDRERIFEKEEEEEGILGAKKYLSGDHGKRGDVDIHEHKRRSKSGFNLPELMKYSEYDRKAWNFFKRFQEDI